MNVAAVMILKLILLRSLLIYPVQGVFFFLLFVQPIKCPRATHGRGLLTEIVVRGMEVASRGVLRGRIEYISFDPRRKETVVIK